MKQLPLDIKFKMENINGDPEVFKIYIMDGNKEMGYTEHFDDGSDEVIFDFFDIKGEYDDSVVPFLNKEYPNIDELNGLIKNLGGSIEQPYVIVKSLEKNTLQLKT